MRKERPEQQPQESFEFTEREKLFDRVSHERFKEIIGHEKTAIHEMSVSSNDYGEFLFVRTSRPKQAEREHITFWGAGYHEFRERWITNEWFWYKSYSNPKTGEKEINKEQAEAILSQRIEEISPYVNDTSQSRSGQLFETLADLTDDDAAQAELQDLGDIFDDFD